MSEVILIILWTFHPSQDSFKINFKVGRAHVGTSPIKSIVEVHPSFGNTDRLGYLRRQVLVDHGLMADKNDKEGGDKWLMQLMHWCRSVMH